MATSRVIHGARVKVGIMDPASGQVNVVGIFNNFSVTVNLDTAPSFILGRLGAADITTTGVEIASMNASGWRVLDHGAYADAGFTDVKDLLTQEYLTFIAVDRVSGKRLCTINNVLPTGMTIGYSARQLSELSCSFVGIMVSDESGIQSEAGDAADLP